MKASALALPLLATLVFTAGAQDLLDAGYGEDARARPGLNLPMTDPVIQKAVRETLADSRPGPLKEGQTLQGEAYDKFSRQMDEARVPSCWRPDAMKHQPPRLGPINLGGILALPFWGAAIVSGKCNR
jgi:hypothetical protein